MVDGVIVGGKRCSRELGLDNMIMDGSAVVGPIRELRSGREHMSCIVSR
jgi:hypothetical protein